MKKLSCRALAPAAALAALLATGCTKEETDFSDRETPESVVVEGRLLTTNGEPLAGIGIRADYTRTIPMCSVTIRHKGAATSDREGRYRLFFDLRDDELLDEESVSRLFSLSFDLASLDPERYLLPDDLTETILPTDPPSAEASGAKPVLELYFLPERGGRYTQNCYIPRKQPVRITLRGFVPEAPGDHFSVSALFPYGPECDEPDKVLQTPYQVRRAGLYRYTASSAETVVKVPFALDEENLLQLVRVRGGVGSTEVLPLFVTAGAEPLTFDFQPEKNES